MNAGGKEQIMFHDIGLETAMYFICSFAMPAISILYTMSIRLLNRENKRNIKISAWSTILILFVGQAFCGMGSSLQNAVTYQRTSDAATHIETAAQIVWVVFFIWSCWILTKGFERTGKEN